MHILIEKDSATKIAREVKSLDEARGFQAQGFTVTLASGEPLPDVEPVADAPVKATTRRVPRAPVPAKAAAKKKR